jgi:tight adherence protein C
MLVAVAALLTFTAVLFIFFSMSLRGAVSIDTRLEALKLGLRPREVILRQPFLTRTVGPVVVAIQHVLLHLLPVSWAAATSRRLVWAGLAVSIEAFVVIWASTAILFSWLAFTFAGGYGLSGGSRLLATGFGLLVGGYAPQFWLSARVTSRRKAMRKALPDALDLMVTSVEAGLSLDAALQRVAEYQSGPFQLELSHALQDMNLGSSRRAALEAMNLRTNLPEVNALVQALVQAELTGAPIGQILRVQAEQIRIKRRQEAEAEAQRAPLKMVVPLVFFILPSLFIVLLAPAMMTIIDALGNFQSLHTTNIVAP